MDHPKRKQKRQNIRCSLLWFSLIKPIAESVDKTWMLRLAVNNSREIQTFQIALLRRTPTWCFRVLTQSEPFSIY